MQINYYAVQVKTREEEKYIRLFRALHPEIAIPVHFPQRVLDIRRKGKIHHSRSAIFPGYIFLELEDEDSILDYHWAFRSTSGFFKFLPSNRNIGPLAGRDLGPALHFIKTVGPLAGKSLVSFDENSRITVIQGPLFGMEGKIVKVDKRKKRAKIRLDLYSESFSVDLSFETIVKAN
jgi:transcriptional antiterminator NusG